MFVGFEDVSESDSFNDRNLMKLIELVVDEEAQGEMDPKRRFKFPMVATGILSSHSEIILDFFLEEETEEESEGSGIGSADEEQESLDGFCFESDDDAAEEATEQFENSEEEEEDGPSTVESTSRKSGGSSGSSWEEEERKEENKKENKEASPMEHLFRCLKAQKERKLGVNEAALGYFIRILKNILKRRTGPVVFSIFKWNVMSGYSTWASFGFLLDC